MPVCLQCGKSGRVQAGRGTSVAPPHLLDAFQDVLPVEVDLGLVVLELGAGQPVLGGTGGRARAVWLNIKQGRMHE